MGLKTDINKLEERLLRRMGLEPTDVFGFKIECEAHEFPKISVQFGAIYLAHHPEVLRTLVNGLAKYRLLPEDEYTEFARFKAKQHRAEAERELGVPPPAEAGKPSIDLLVSNPECSCGHLYDEHDEDGECLLIATNGKPCTCKSFTMAQL